MSKHGHQIVVPHASTHVNPDPRLHLGNSPQCGEFVAANPLLHLIFTNNTTVGFFNRPVQLQDRNSLLFTLEVPTNVLGGVSKRSFCVKHASWCRGVTLDELIEIHLYNDCPPCRLLKDSPEIRDRLTRITNASIVMFSESGEGGERGVKPAFCSHYLLKR